MRKAELAEILLRAVELLGQPDVDGVRQLSPQGGAQACWSLCSLLGKKHLGKEGYAILSEAGSNLDWLSRHPQEVGAMLSRPAPVELE